MKTLNQRVVAITGAGSGIGRQLAIQAAAHGSLLALSDVDVDGLEATAAECRLSGNNPIETAIVDVADRSAMGAWAESVNHRFGAVHVIINNAGVGLGCSVEDMSYDDFDWLMNINFWGVINGCKAFLPYLKAAEEAHVVNVSSLFGLVSVPYQSAYNAAKFAVRGFTESLSQEMLLSSPSVNVSCVHPGGVKTDIANRARFNGEFAGLKHDVELVRRRFNERLAITSAEKAAATIIKGILKQRRRILVGRDAKQMDWIQRLFPAGYQKLVTKLLS